MKYVITNKMATELKYCIHITIFKFKSIDKTEDHLHSVVLYIR